jgi:transposase
MLSLSLPLDIWLCLEPTDMRCGYDRLAQRALEHARRDVLRGGLFVFFNRRRDRVKLLYWDQDGYAMWQKRLESGRFELPGVAADQRSVTLSQKQLALILWGVDLASVRMRKRYARPA